MAELNFTILVQDSRLWRSTWRLETELLSPPTPTDGASDVITDAVSTKDEAENPVPLTTTGRTMHTQADAFPDNVSIDLGGQLWLYIPANAGLRDTAYEATIHWALIDAP